MEDGRDSEIRIDLLAGSYVPQFRFIAEKPVLPSDAMAGIAAMQPLRAPPGAIHRRWIWVASAVFVALAIAVSVRFVLPASAFDQFWHPPFSSSNPALLCVGGGQTMAASGDTAQTVRDFDSQPSRRMHVSDAMALAGLAGLLQSNGKPYRIMNRSGATSFRDLQSGPFVLIGGMNNEWTLRLTEPLRFSFERAPNGARVMDKQNPSNTAWTVEFNGPLAQFSRDYAIVSRLRDSKTEQTAVIVAGIGSWGTQAAAEFVTTPEHLRKLEAFAPKRWEGKNLQVVITTDVIRGSSARRLCWPLIFRSITTPEIAEMARLRYMPKDIGN